MSIFFLLDGSGAQQVTYIIPAQHFPHSTAATYQLYPPPTTTTAGYQSQLHCNTQLPVAATPSSPPVNVYKSGNSHQGNAPPQTPQNNINVPPSNTPSPSTTNPTYNANQPHQQAPRHSDDNKGKQ